MKTKLSKKVLSLALTTVMMFLFIPFSLFNLVKAETALPQIDYTPFLIETTDDNKTIYNAETADMLFDFYNKASGIIQSDKTTMQSLSSMNFTSNGVTYTPTGVYYIHPEDLPSCGMLACVLNYDVNGQDMHTMLICFKGTSTDPDFFTDLLAFSNESESFDYHWGFYNAAKDHLARLQNNSIIRFNTGIEEDDISFGEYIEKMKTSDNYNMFVTGHSLGAAVANIFTKAFINPILGDKAEKSAVAYTFATPLTCSSDRKNANNIFNFVNNNDIVPKIGYLITNDIEVVLALQGIGVLGVLTSIPIVNTVGGAIIGLSYSAFLGRSYRSGTDLQASWGCAWIIADVLSFSFNNHKMSENMYGKIKNHISNNISDYLTSFVLYSNYDADSHTHQTIIYDNGTLIVSGSGKLSGNWHENTMTNWNKIQSKCTSLVFDTDCHITEIGDYAFAGMTHLQNDLHLPNSLKKIGDYAFFNCRFDGDLKIPESMVYVGDGAFRGCINLDSIDASNATLNWGKGAFLDSVGQNDLHLNVEDSGTDLAKVFKQYNVSDKYGTYHITVDNAYYGNEVLPGDKIYLGRIQDEDLEIHPYYNFHYLLTQGHTYTADNIEALAKTELENIASVDEFGCITISENCDFGDKDSIEFTVVVMDNVNGEPDYDVYDSNRFIHFTVIKKNSDFAGGIGTEERPYLIENADHFDNISKADNNGNYFLNKYYQLLNDIDFGGATISSSGTLAGGFDGNGYTLYNFRIEGKEASLFDRIENGAYVKNLTIGKEGKFASVRITANGKSDIKAAALACVNKGTVKNCTVINTRICSEANVEWDAHQTIYSYAAGLVADNYGRIENCHVESCMIIALSKTDEDASPARCEAYSGGLIALNADGGKIISSSVKSCDITAAAESIDSGIWIWGNWEIKEGRGYTYCGGIAARSTSEIAIKDCYVFNNTRNAIITADGGQTFSELFQAGGDIKAENCKESDHNCITPITSISIGRLTSGTSTDNTENDTPIYKTNYYVGEELNLYGLVVRDNNNDIISNYTVEGFDNTTPGTKTVTIKYNTGYSSEPLTATFDVTVHDIVPIFVEVKAKDKESPYEVNYTVTPDDLVATVYYNNGDVEEIDSIGNYSGQWIKFSTFETLLAESTEYVITLDYTYTVDGVEKNGYASTLINAYCDHSITELVDAIEATTTSPGYTGDVTCITCHDIIEEGEIIDTLYIPGDINNDGKVDNKDTTVLMKYFAGWDVEVNYNALDVNEDGIINSKDTTRLMQYIAGWNAFENTDNFNNEENWTDGVLYLDKHLIKARDTVIGKLIIEAGTTSIANRAFENCNDVSVIIIPDSVIHIGEDAFANCANLKAVYYLGTKSDLTAEAVNNVSDILYFYSEEHPTEEGNFWHWVDGEPTVWCVDIVTDEAANPTCTETGLTEGSHCDECGTVIVEQIIITAVGHKEVIDSAVEPTCTETGLTEGKHCSVCGTAIVEQKTLSMIDHDYVDDTCTMCGKPAFTPTPYEYFKFTLLADGTYSIKAKDVNNMPSEVVIPSVYDSKQITTISRAAFRNSSNLTSVRIPNSITTIEGGAFYNCSNLSSVVIGNNVTSVQYGVFGFCSSLTNVVIPDSVTTIGDSAFGNCYNLINITVDENNPNYMSIDGNLYSKDGKTLIQYTIGKENTSFDIPDSVTSIGRFAFAYCDSLTSVVIPDSVTSIGDYSFLDCTNLTNVVIPNGVTYIDNYTFSGCYSLTSIVIPDSITSIGEYAFEGCTSLTDVYYTGSEEDWENISILSYNSYLTNATIHYNYVPEE